MYFVINSPKQYYLLKKLAFTKVYILDLNIQVTLLFLLNLLYCEVYLQQIKSGIFHKSEFLELWLLESAKNISYSDIQIDHRNKIQSSSHLLRYYRVVKKKNRRWENVDLNFMTSFLSKAAHQIFLRSLILEGLEQLWNQDF